MRKLLLTVVSLFFLPDVNAQSQIASPKIVNYNSSQYKAGLQNWDIAQDKNGILYFGNNEGLLSFNGRYWKNYPLPNLTFVRSVKVDAKNRIFVGAQDELGYFFPDTRGVLQYHSLRMLMPEKERLFADIWDISIVNDEVFFRSTRKVFHLKENKLNVYKPESSWLFLGDANGNVYAQEEKKGLMVFRAGEWKILLDTKALDNAVITSVLPYHKDTLLIVTRHNGLYLLADGRIAKMPTEVDGILYTDRILSANLVNDQWFVIGSSSSGIVIIDRFGRLVQKYSDKEGLQKNKVHFAFIDNNKSLWLALDDGIDLIAINSAIKYINPNRNTGYAINVFENSLYVGTSNGLQVTKLEPGLSDLSLSKGDFREVPQTKGQVWNLTRVNNRLFIGHEDGLFTIKKGAVNRVYTSPGTWIFTPFSTGNSSAILAGTYRGLQNIASDGEESPRAISVQGIDESLRFVALEKSSNTLWSSHPYHGVYKLVLSPDGRSVINKRLYTKKDGLPSTLYNYVYKIKNRIVVATEDGLYQFDTKSGRFSPSPLFRDVTKGVSIQYLREDGKGNVWFVSNKRVACIDIGKPSGRSSYSVVYLHELNGKVVGGHEFIYPVDDENIFIGGNTGFFHVNYTKYMSTVRRPEVIFGEIRIFGKADSTIFGGYFLKDRNFSKEQDLEYKASIPRSFNSVHFEYSSTLFDQQANVEFSYRLKGFDGGWSAWSDKSEKDYTNLPPGEYAFLIKARNKLGNESDIKSYSFYVEPAWYQTYWSYLFYLSSSIGAVLLLLKWQRKKHQKQQERLNYLFQLELDRNEKEIVRLKNEKLESEMNFKNRELASMTMHLVQRGEVLVKVKEVISALVKKNELSDNLAFKQLLRLIREVERTDADWDQFTAHFNTVNTDFFDVLRGKYPDLTPNELKLCAYLKMNLSSKEIAQLMNITIKAVEVARYRLRKKLQLPSETKLELFISEMQKKSPRKIDSD